MEYTFKEKVMGAVISLFRKTMSLFSLKTRYRFFEAMGMLAYFSIRKRRELTIDNIRNAFPEKTEEEVIKIAKESYRTMGKMIATSIFLDEITENGNTYLENEELMRNACENNEKAVLIVSLHLGGFEAGSIMKSIRKFYAVFRRQKNRKINSLMSEWREKGGLNPLALHDTEALNSAVREKSIIALASDHFGSDVEVEYFGRKTTAVSGPVLLALKHKIPLVLAYAVFEGDKIRVVNDKVIEIEKKGKIKETVAYNMQKIYSEFERIIRKYPEQYMWQHKRWRS